jgi:hypothetical protein
MSLMCLLMIKNVLISKKLFLQYYKALYIQKIFGGGASKIEFVDSFLS